MPKRPSERTAPPDWSEYDRYTAGRGPRPLFLLLDLVARRPSSGGT